MTGMKGVLRGLAMGATAAALLATAALPAGAQPAPPPAPLLDVSNPQPGDYVPRAKLLISGVACDPHAVGGPSGTGIRRIAAYFGDRDTLEGVPSWRPGGYLGSASIDNNQPQPASTLGLPTTSTLCPQGNAGFQIITGTLSGGRAKQGVWDLNIYALSVSGAEAHIRIPGIRVALP